ncbi:hypothetical protein ABIA35_006950 [Catenulispora sp. MAP12-49]|uniref:hypothetical protein n=1 Tax=Catenulispora sp. MAP12-49 TaxID=3156302 RepID=UPI003514392A
MAIFVAVTKAVASVVLTLGAIIVGPVFSANWNIAMRFGTIAIQLAAGIWRAGAGDPDSRRERPRRHDSRPTEEMPCESPNDQTQTEGDSRVTDSGCRGQPLISAASTLRAAIAGKGRAAMASASAAMDHGRSIRRRHRLRGRTPAAPKQFTWPGARHGNRT